jgi:peroxiredoxin Q/BCP
MKFGSSEMKLALIAFLLAGVAAHPAAAALKSGDKAPDFKTEASLAGKTFDFSLKKALKKGPVVVYFYPAAYTKGCDIEAHTFAETKEKFDAAGATIIGVSNDKIARLNQFSADPDYCAGKDAKIVATLSSADDKISPAEHVDKSLAVVSELTGKGK